MGFWDFLEDVFRMILAAIVSIITSQHKTKAHPESPSAPAYSVTYPEEYVRNHFIDRMNNYWHPQYRKPINNLYDNAGRIYHRTRY